MCSDPPDEAEDEDVDVEDYMEMSDRALVSGARQTSMAGCHRV